MKGEKECGTCKHWPQGTDKKRRCRNKMVQKHVATVYKYVIVFFDKEFGCKWHEYK